MSLIDISPLIDASIRVWPGDTPYERTINLDMAAGANLTLSDIRTTVHVGAHADAPSHYVAAGQDIAARSLHFYVGPCVVLHVEGVRGRRIVPEDLAGKTLDVPRVLLATGTFPSHHAWNEGPGWWAVRNTSLVPPSRPGPSTHARDDRSECSLQ